jgi:hypothetical protein
MGWAGLLPTVLPWIQALIWAFKPTDIIDVRRFPREEARAIDEEMARLKGGPRADAGHGNAAAVAAAPHEAPPPPSPAPSGTTG